jgi:hypothetical protein
MTTSKANAMLFIEKLYAASLSNNFRFNMKKLRTNFELNVSKISYAIEAAKAQARAAALAAKGETAEKTVPTTQKLDQRLLADQ